jgi:hypothetical protein
MRFLVAIFFKICHKNKPPSMRLLERRARMHVPGGGLTYNHIHIFMLLCIYIYVNINRFYDIISVYSFPSIYCLFMIFLFTFYSKVYYIYALSRYLTQYAYCVHTIYTICLRYLRHTFMQGNRNSQKRKQLSEIKSFVTIP